MAVEIAEVLEVGPGWNKVRGTDGNIYTLKGDYNWRSNNPGNIEYGPFAISQGAIASGAVPSGRERGFAIFPTLSAGEKAREVLQFESPSYRDLSIAQAISRYAPPSENNTQAYINAVTQAAGVAPGTRMSELTPQQRAAFLSAQARVEGNMRQGDIFTADGVRLPPGEIPNVVASRLDTTPQTRDVPFPQPRPQRMANVPMPRLDPRKPNRMDLAAGLIPTNVMRQDLALQGMSYAGMDRALPSARPIGFPTPVSQRPAQSPVGFPTPVSQRPIMAASSKPLRVTVNGGNYAATQPSRAQQIAEVLARSRGPSAFGGGGTIDGAVQPVGTLFGRR